MATATKDRTKDSSSSKVQSLTSAEKNCQAQVKLLLVLSDRSGESKWGDVTKTSVPSGVSAPKILQSLADEGLVKVSKGARGAKFVQIADQGRVFLRKTVASPELKFSSQQSMQGAMLNLLLTVVQELAAQPGLMETNGHAHNNGTSKAAEIISYEEFEEIALEIYDRLNQDYNLGDLVPIYRIRREIGNRVSRNHFNDWLLEIQANDLFQLISGELPSATPDQMEDSLEIPGIRIRIYARKL